MLPTTKKYIEENQRKFFGKKLESDWTKEAELQFKIGSLEEKLKKAKTKIRMQNKIIEALTK
tara:strand:- start:987 stop:1172 length:186 start_codon:yes stop_codon:yes gene_type:complete